MSYIIFQNLVVLPSASRAELLARAEVLFLDVMDILIYECKGFLIKILEAKAAKMTPRKAYWDIVTGGSSATYGAPIVKTRAAKLQTPKAVATMLTGKRV